MNKLISTALCITLIALASCKKDSGSDSSSTSGTTTTIPAPYQKIYGATSIAVEGDYIVIKCNALPDHKSPYYKGTQWESAKYESYTDGHGTNPHWNQNPNSIATADITLKIPKDPKVASTHAATPGGVIGVSLNGVPFFNQYAAMGAPLTGEINSFDQYDGHPQQQGVYHYHAEPYYLTANKGKSALLGFLLDGFPVYGPEENGKTVASTDLDAYHGHTSVTTDYPSGIYHYHTTTESPYINGSGFYGTPGTVTQ